METVKLTASDDLVLTSWYRPPLRSDLPTEVYFHGNVGHIGYRGFLVKPFLEEG